MRKLLDMFQDLKDGISGKKKSKVGPVGEAILVVANVIKDAQDRGMYDKSILMKAMAVILDHIKQQRACLHDAVALVNAVEDSKVDAAKVPALVAEFKRSAVKARLHQYVPEGNYKKLESLYSDPPTPTA